MGNGKPETRAILDEAVGENLDRLISLDMRGDLFLPKIYRRAREHEGRPLVLAAAEKIVAAVNKDRRGILILTGFRIPPTGAPETDGIIGSAVIAHTLMRALGAIPVFACEPEVQPVLEAALTSVGLSSTTLGTDWTGTSQPSSDAIIVNYELDTDASDVAALFDRLEGLALCLAIERPGRNAQGYYHFAGGARVEGVIAPVDDLYELLQSRGVPTVAIGDFGNELGMGVLRETVADNIPSGRDCGCGCGGGIACPTLADVTIACTVSDWGAYALAAMICHLRDRPDAYISLDLYRRTVNEANLAGAIDGTSRLAIPDIDGISLDFNGMLVEMIRGVVSYPNRPMMENRNRMYAAEQRRGLADLPKNESE